jgi:hypothetical protein
LGCIENRRNECCLHNNYDKSPPHGERASITNGKLGGPLTMNGNPFADMMTGTHATRAAVFGAMFAVIARRAGVAGKRTRASRTKSCSSEENNHCSEENIFHASDYAKSQP